MQGERVTKSLLKLASQTEVASVLKMISINDKSQRNIRGAEKHRSKHTSQLTAALQLHVEGGEQGP